MMYVNIGNAAWRMPDARVEGACGITRALDSAWRPITLATHSRGSDSSEGTVVPSQSVCRHRPKCNCFSAAIVANNVRTLTVEIVVVTW